jgi:hypothetical protein
VSRTSRARAAESRSLRRAVVLSIALHAVIGVAGRCGTSARPRRSGQLITVDVDLVPAPPLAEQLPDEILRNRLAMNQAVAPEPEPEPVAGVSPYDARPAEDDEDVDARTKRRRADAAEADSDASVDDDGDTEIALVDAAAATQVAQIPSAGGEGSGSGSGSGSGFGSGSGGSGSGSSSGDGTAAAAVALTPGTGANLLAYFPDGQVVTAMVRFDRIRGTQWQAPIDALFEPMPDHQMLIGGRDLSLADLFDTLVISSQHPTNPIATTLVVKHAVNRPRLRDVLDEPESPVAWSVAAGGMYGARSPGKRVMRGDRRQFVAPYLGWIVLAHPRDLPGLAAAGAGELDTAVATVALPPWLDGIRAIEDESGKPTGPALVVTLAAGGTRIDLPDVGLDLTSLPGPERMTIALELADTGFLIRGNLRFASDADAVEAVDSITRTRDKILGSTLLKALLKRSKALNAVTGLSLDRRGARVSYATSISAGDAQGLLAVAAQYLDAYFQAAAHEANDQ